jgi:hypothetical protein
MFKPSYFELSYSCIALSFVCICMVFATMSKVTGRLGSSIPGMCRDFFSRSGATYHGPLSLEIKQPERETDQLTSM